MGRVQHAEPGVGVEDAVDGERQHGEHDGHRNLGPQARVEAHQQNTQAHDPEQLSAGGKVQTVGLEKGKRTGAPRISPRCGFEENVVGPGEVRARGNGQHGEDPERQVHDGQGQQGQDCQVNEHIEGQRVCEALGGRGHAR